MSAPGPVSSSSPSRIEGVVRAQETLSTTITTGIPKIMEQFKKLKSTLAEQQSRNAALTSQVTDLTGKLEAKDQLHTEAQTQLRKATEKLHTQDTSLSKAQAQISQLTAEKTALNEKLAQLEEQLRALNTFVQGAVDEAGD